MYRVEISTLCIFRPRHYQTVKSKTYTYPLGSTSRHYPSLDSYLIHNAALDKNIPNNWNILLAKTFKKVLAASRSSETHLPNPTNIETGKWYDPNLYRGEFARWRI